MCVSLKLKLCGLGLEVTQTAKTNNELRQARREQNYTDAH